MSTSVLALTSISAALAMGFAPAVLRGFSRHLQADLQLSEYRLAWLERLLYLSWLPLMPLAGWAVDHWNARDVVFVGSLALALAVAWLALCKTSRSAAWGVAGLSVAGACLSTAGVVIMPASLTFGIAPPGGVRRGATLAALCLGFFFAGVASLLGPRLLTWVTTRNDPKRSGLFLAAACLLPALLAALSAPPETDPALLGEVPFFDARFGLVALAALLYFPLELSLQIWPSPYLAELGYSPPTNTRLLAGFWCTFCLLRLALAFQASFWRYTHETWLVLALVLLGSMVLGNLAGAYAPGSGYVGLWLAGACYGPVLPALVAMLELPQAHGIPGQAVGVVFAIGAACALVAQPLLTRFAKRHAPRESLRIAMVLGLLMAAPLLLLAVLASR